MGFEAACKSILEKYSNVPVSLETDLRGIELNSIHKNPIQVRDTLLKQAYELSSWAKNVIVKIPICEGGLLAAEELMNRGIQTNITACMNVQQAMEAKDRGIGYISLFANRMLDSYILQLSGHSLNEIVSNPNWKKALEENKAKYFEQAWGLTLRDISQVADSLSSSKQELIIGSIRSPEDIYRIISAKPQVITIPTKIVQGLENITGLKLAGRRISSQKSPLLVYHPMTEYTLAEFEKAADAYRKR